MKTFSVYLPDDLHEKLRRAAFERKQSMSSLTVEVLEKFLTKEGAKMTRTETTWEHLGSWDRPQYREYLDEGGTPQALVEELLSTGTIEEEHRLATLRFLRNEARAIEEDV